MSVSRARWEAAIGRDRVDPARWRHCGRCRHRRDEDRITGVGAHDRYRPWHRTNSRHRPRSVRKRWSIGSWRLPMPCLPAAGESGLTCEASGLPSLGWSMSRPGLFWPGEPGWLVTGAAERLLDLSPVPWSSSMTPTPRHSANAGAGQHGTWRLLPSSPSAPGSASVSSSMGELHRGAHHAAGELGDLVVEHEFTRAGARQPRQSGAAIGGRRFVAGRSKPPAMT